MSARVGPALQRGFPVRFDWGEEGLLAIGPGSDVVVIVDVLSFSTAVTVAVGRGAVVVPRSPGSGAPLAGAEVASGVILAGRRGAETTGGAFTLSPASLQHLPAGAALVLPSPNGSHLSTVAAGLGCRVMLGCLRNARAVAGRCTGRVAVVAAGERWPDGTLRAAVEDLCGAGAVLARFDRDGLSPEALAAVAVANAGVDLRECASARELRERGYADDVRIALERDASDTVPVLVDGAFRAS